MEEVKFSDNYTDRSESTGAETKGAKFCPDCGQALAQKTACPKCAAKLTAGAKFCPECGEKV